MAATLTINLKDNATPGLQELEQQLAQTGKATGTVATDTRALTVAQQEQIKVIHEHRAAWSQLAATVGPIFVNIVQGAAAAGFAYAQYRANAVAAQRATRLLGTAAKTAVGAVSGLGTQFAGAGIAAAGARIALRNTGLEIQQLKVDSDDMRAATDKQRIAFERLRIEVARSGGDFREYAESHREELAALGVSVQTNYDRVSKSSSKLGKDLVAPFRDGVGAAREWINQVEYFKEIWKGFDKDLSQGTKNFEANAKAGGNAFRSIAAGAAGITSQAFGGEDASAVASQLKAYRELEEAQQKLGKRQKESIDDFTRMRQVSESFEKQRKEAAERRKTDLVSDLSLSEERNLTDEQQAAARIGRINTEIDRQKELAGQKAALHQFDEEQQKKLEIALQSLESQRTSIVREQEAKRKEVRKAALEEHEKREKDSLERRAQNEADALRRSVDRYNQWASDVRASQERLNDFAQDYADQSNNAILNNLITRLDAEGNHTEEAHTARKKLIQQETDQRIAAADTQEEREREFYAGLMRLQREELAHNQRVIREEVATRKQAAEEALRIEKTKKDELTRLLQDAGGPSGKDLLGQIDPRKALQDQRGKAAADSARNRVLNDPRNQQLRDDALTSVEANNRLKRMQEQAARQAEREARAGAFRDFNRGKADPREIAQAQSQTGQQMLQTMQQNGQLSGDVVQIVQQQLQAAADQQGTLSRLEQQVAQLQRASQVVGNGARAQRQRAQQGSVQ